MTVFSHRAFWEPRNPHPKVYKNPRHFENSELGKLTSPVEEYRKRLPDDLVVIIAEVTKLTSYRAVPGNGTSEVYKDLKARLSKLSGGRFPKHIIDSVINERPHQPYVPGEGGVVRGNAAWVPKYHGGIGVFPEYPRPSSPKAIGLLT